MRCANENCRSREMKYNFIKITKPGRKTIYYCSQRCFNKSHKVEFRWGFQRDVKDDDDDDVFIIKCGVNCLIMNGIYCLMKYNSKW